MRIVVIAIACLIFPIIVQAECPPKQDHRSDKSGGIQVGDFVIRGTLKMSSREISGITSSFTGACFNEDSQELEERVRAEFQNRGYVTAEVKSLKSKTLDILANPKLADLEAEVFEGPRYRFSEIEFTGNHAFPAKRLRREFPIRSGDVFDRGKIGGGLEAILQLYASHGYVDVIFIPDTHPAANATMLLAVTVEEGKQYRMGALYIQAKKEVSDQLRQNWGLIEGQVFNQAYLAKFIDANHAQLPKDFTQEGSVRVLRNCDDATVQVVLLVDSSQPPPPVNKDTGCKSEVSSPHQPAGN